MQKILSLIITGAILYMIIQVKMDGGHESKENNEAKQQEKTVEATAEIKPDLTGNLIEKTLSGVLVNVLKTEEGKLFFENILKPIDKPIAGVEGFKVNNANLIKSIFKITDFDEGTIGPASCGHVVTIFYQILDLNNNLIEEQTKTFVLGSKPVLLGLDSVVVGMMIGQTRHAVLSAKYAYQDNNGAKTNLKENTTYKVSVVLKEMLPKNIADNKEVKIFDDEIAYKTPLICGDRTSFNAKITKLANGQVIYDSVSTGSKITMDIGNITYPMIFSHALFGKIPVGTRTVIAKGKNFKSLGLGSSVIFPKEQLPQDEYFMLELTDF